MFQREQIHQRLIADDHAGGMDAGVAHDVFEHESGVHEFARHLLGVVRLLEVRRLLERLLQRHLQLVWNHLRQPVALAVAQAHHATHIADDGLRAHRAEGDDLRDGIAAVLLADVFDDIGAAVIGEVDVDVGRIDALGIEKALEEQAVADGIDVGDLEQVGDDGTGGGTARHAGDADLASVPDEVRADEEVADEPGLLDDGQLDLEAVDDDFDGSGDLGVSNQ